MGKKRVNALTPDANGTLPIPDTIKANFTTLSKAMDATDVCVMSAVRKADRKPVWLICAVNYNSDEKGQEYEFVPLAEMIDGNPYELYDPPTMTT